MYRLKPHLFFCTSLLVWAVIILGWPATVYAGIYDSNTEITYTEYWVDHEEFIGKCSEPEPGGDEFYIEPTAGCQITLDFSISEDLNLVNKVEIYLDLWRNHVDQRAQFKINNGPWRKPNVGDDWSRTPYVAEVPLTDFWQDDNTITFKGIGYHVHDIAFRVYGAASLSAPTGSLGNVKDDGSTKSLSSGGVLNVNGDQLELSATVSSDAELLEFHAYYDGYDEDNDGIFRDWHNLGRNNWHPGGTDEFSSEAALGGTINHVGTVAVGGAGTYSITWDIPHIINQNGVKFKIRVLDANGNVREAAGGVSASFELKRNFPVVYFINPSFEDIILWHDGDYDPTASSTVNLPILADFDAGYLIGAYWLRPNIYFNGDPLTFANRYNAFPNHPGAPDEWTLSILSIGNTGSGYIPFAKLQSGENSFLFENRTSAWGAFVENPGPMVVLRGKSSPPSDTTAPSLISNSPADNATGIAVDTNITLRLVDYNSGLNLNSFNLNVNGTNLPFNDSRISRVGSDYDTTFIYDPSTDFSQGENVTVTVNVSDLAGNAMSAESFSFKITEPDFDPPIISNVQCVPGSDKLTLVWTTDEMANSTVNYGLTAALGSTVSDPTLVTAHSVEITGLSSETEHHFQIVSDDSSGNSTIEPAAATLTCTTAGPSSLQSDDFNACALDTTLWTYIDPIGDVTMSATSRQIKFEIPANSDHDVWTGGNNSARIMQVANNATFEIDTKFETGITAQKQIQGIIIEEDSDTYLRISFGMDNVGTVRIYAFYLDGGSATEKLSGNGRPLDSSVDPSGPLYLRVWRQSPTLWTIFYSGDGVTWLQGGGYDFTQALNVTAVGAFAGNASGAQAYTSIVDYFFRTDLPISPEDATALQLGTSVSPINKGSITSSASCGNPVQLTATPMPGWSFDSWTSLQGSTMTTTNPISITFPYSEVVTANFVQDYYEIFTNVEDGLDGQTGGSITVSDPSSPSGYEYNQLVTITAAPSIGWQFDGWAGDVNGSSLSTTLTMTNNRSVTANFSRIPYAIDISITGQGEVISNPTSGPYHYNDLVSLLAVAEPGWTFDSWSGAVTGNSTTVDLTIDGNESISAVFTQDQYVLSVSNSGTGSGAVEIDPAASSYTHGDVVTLTANASSGSTFAGWSGAGLSGSNASVTLTMEQSESVVAEFTQNYYTVTLGATNGGTIILSPSNDPKGYVYNEIATVSALASSGYEFLNWTGALSGSTSPALLTVTGTQTVGAVFRLIPVQSVSYTLTVSSSEGGLANPMGGIYPENTLVELTATANEGFAFVNWTDGTGQELSTAKTLAVMMDGDKVVKANFEVVKVGEFTLTQSVTGSGSIMSNPTGGSFQAGTEVTLTAVPQLGWSFAGWSGSTSGSDETIKLIINGNSEVTANFTQNRYAISTVVVGNGSVAISAAADAQGYVYNEQATLVATPDEGWTFAGWEISGGRATGENPATLAVADNTVVTATFVEESNTVSGMSVESEGLGEVQMTPQKSAYTMGEEITLTAVPMQGWRFVRWDINIPLASGVDRDATVTVKAADDMNIRAIFERAGAELFLPIINS